jgi:pentose-5-phosphate-3-epimerase
MSVVPGYSGQKFMPEMIGKVEEIRNKLNTLRSPPTSKWMAA